MGTSHCHDMMSSRSTDSSYLRSGRQVGFVIFIICNKVKYYPECAEFSSNISKLHIMIIRI